MMMWAGRRRQRGRLLAVLGLAAFLAGVAGYLWWLFGLDGAASDAPLAVWNSRAGVASLALTAVGLPLTVLGTLYGRRAARLAALDLTPLETQLRRQLRRRYGDRKGELQLTTPLKVEWRPISKERQVTARESQRLDDSQGRDVAALARAFTRLKSPQMVIVGPPGCGKSVTALLLAEELLSDEEAERRWLPVLVSFSDWRLARERGDGRPARQPLREWIAAQIDQDFLDSQADFNRRDAAALVDGGRIPIILDGFDELAPDVGALALQELTCSGTEGLPFIVTCRLEPYQQAVETSRRALGRAAVAELQPIGDPKEIMKFLTAASFTHESDRWEQVRARMRDRKGALFNVLRNPLMAHLANVAVRDGGKEPDELAALEEEADIRRYLFEHYLPALYGGDAQRATKQLGVLARLLESRQEVALAWWRLHLQIPNVHKRVGVTIALATFAAFALQYGPFRPFSLMAGFVAYWLAMSITLGGEPRHLGLHHQRLLLAGLAGIAAGMGAFALAPPDLRWFAAAVIGLPTAGWAALLLSAHPPRRSDPSRPRTMLGVQRAALLAIVLMGLIRALIQTPHGMFSLMIELAETLFYCVVICAAARVGGAWLTFNLARIWLFFKWDFPWKLMTFLEEAHRLGVLRRSGSVYQFRNVEIQRHLASIAQPALEKRSATARVSS
ncbi:hypothetical protein [Nonomuraea sp. NPDC050202]|uniref:hypothetical protein n=1 Tax=Nonomuraea sp. NPDC050202 TaxID=3155035 RepID=UPI0033FE1229